MIYIVGNNSLSCYIAAKLQDVGKDTTIISGRADSLHLNTNGITLKEEHNLLKKHYRFKTSLMMREEPELVIISCDTDNINSHLTTISKKIVQNVPIILFTPLRNISYIKHLFNSDIIRAYFDGYFIQKEQSISLLGRSPCITLSGSPEDPLLQSAASFLEIISPNIYFEDDNKAFWSYFIPYASGSISSTFYQQNISQLVKEQTSKEELRALTEEIITIANKEGCYPNKDDILGRLYTTPSSYTYPLLTTLKTHSRMSELSTVCGTLTNLSHQYKTPIPTLSRMIKKIYTDLA
ncbi:MAG: hypothetical protein LBL47_00575 [Lactobacillus sp.]|jgi:ketopantoate reductase|nr:hypothetical protein [Lactobacillus sp.]